MTAAGSTACLPQILKIRKKGRREHRRNGGAHACLGHIPFSLPRRPVLRAQRRGVLRRRLIVPLMQRIVPQQPVKVLQQHPGVPRHRRVAQVPPCKAKPTQRQRRPTQHSLRQMPVVLPVQPARVQQRRQAVQLQQVRRQVTLNLRKHWQRQRGLERRMRKPGRKRPGTLSSICWWRLSPWRPGNRPQRQNRWSTKCTSLRLACRRVTPETPAQLARKV